jgi:hypothetical protein
VPHAPGSQATASTWSQTAVAVGSSKAGHAVVDLTADEDDDEDGSGDDGDDGSTCPAPSQRRPLQAAAPKEAASACGTPGPPLAAESVVGEASRPTEGPEGGLAGQQARGAASIAASATLTPPFGASMAPVHEQRRAGRGLNLRFSHRTKEQQQSQPGAPDGDTTSQHRAPILCATQAAGGHLLSVTSPGSSAPLQHAEGEGGAAWTSRPPVAPSDSICTSLQPSSSFQTADSLTGTGAGSAQWSGDGQSGGLGVLRERWAGGAGAPLPEEGAAETDEATSALADHLASALTPTRAGEDVVTPGNKAEVIDLTGDD